mmetsp:Transcript_1271/g.1509  ORF Transcript_1271/g.1509 Transcript_1271/m.1509 type:complete len:126 (-) Transcript_1271:1566-1943(-)
MRQHPRVQDGTGKVKLNQNMDMLIIPNSCHSVIFLNKKNYPVSQSDSIMFSLESSKLQRTLTGEWSKVNLKFNDVIGSKDFHPETSMTVQQKVFLTNDKSIYPDIEGFIGFSPCPQSYNDYSFYY